MNQPLDERRDQKQPTPLPQRRRRGRGEFWTEKMARWTIANILALVPLFAGFLGCAASGTLPALADLIGRGQLLVGTMLLCVSCALELVTKQQRSAKSRTIFAAGATMSVLVLAAVYYARIFADTTTGMQIDRALVSVHSLWIRAWALVAGGRCIYLSEAR